MAKIERLPTRSAADAAPPTRSPARQALANAIERQAAAKASLANVEAAKARAVALWNAAARAIETARAELAEIRAGEPRRLVAALMADASPSDGTATLRAAEAQVEKAEAAERTAAEAAGLIDRELASARDEASRAHSGVRDTVAVALKSDPAVATLIAERRATQQRLVDLNGALEALSRHGGIPDGADDRSQMLYGASSLQASWEEATEALLRDADAPLPDVAVEPQDAA